MDSTANPSRSLPFLRHAAAIALLVILAAVSPASAETFFVSDIIDAIPAPPGSLRAAIEASEVNGVADEILFLIDGGTIELVAPLPDLLEGRLRIGEGGPAPQPTASNGIAISGVNGVERAIHIRSKGNLISGLDFVGFQGAEVILISGDQAAGNTISGCVFGRDNAAFGNAGAAIRIAAGALSLGNPEGTEIRSSRFVLNGAGIVIQGDGTANQRSGTWIRNSWFGTNALGGPGPGTGEAINATGAGAVLVQENRFSGPGLGITLDTGSDRSDVVDNRIGLLSADVTDCSGFADAAVSVLGSSGVTVSGNRISCSQVGIFLGPGTSGARVVDNSIGGAAPGGQRSHGILIDSTEGSLIRRNRIVGNDGFGISVTPGPIIDPTPGSLIVCNSIWNNLGGALQIPGVSLLPPVLTSATPVQVAGDLPDPVPGWVEVFGDSADQSRVFQGAVGVATNDPPFRHRLPVLGLTAAKGPAGLELKFDEEIPANHAATLSSEPLQETTELSDPFPAGAFGLVHDLIRGKLDSLSLAAGGGIDLGAVVCLEAGLPAGSVITPDPEIPPPDAGFFYLLRKRDELSNLPGTYDPAICLTDVGRFSGPRRPASGDCP